MSTVTLTRTSTQLLGAYKSERRGMSADEQVKKLKAIVKRALIEGQKGARVVQIAQLELRELQTRLNEECRLSGVAILIAGVAGGALLGGGLGIYAASAGYTGTATTVAVAAGSGAVAGGAAGGIAAQTLNNYRANKRTINQTEYALLLAALNEIEKAPEDTNNNKASEDTNNNTAWCTIL